MNQTSEDGECLDGSSQMSSQFCVCVCGSSPGLELCEPSLRLMATVLAGLMTVAGELLLLAIALGCQTWRGLLGAGAAPLTLFLSYGYNTVSPVFACFLCTV